MKHIVIRSAALIVLLVSSALITQAQPLYEKVLSPQPNFWLLAEQEAQQGNVYAMYRIAYNCRWGQAGYQTDYKRAMDLCLKASEFGYPFAQHLIGNMYVTGSGVEKSTETAYKWYRKALENLKRYADQGNIEAMDMLGEYYDVYFEDYTKSLYWNLRALERGGTTASDIALAHEYSKGVDKDENFALAWYARTCIDYEKKGWNPSEYPAYSKLKNAGYIKSEWEALAEPTYISVPRVSSNNADSIQQVMLLTLDILRVKSDEFRIQQRRLAANRPGAGSAVHQVNTTSTYSASSKPTNTISQQTTPRKHKWFSSLSRVFHAITKIPAGNIAKATGGTHNRLIELQQLFGYSGSIRKGQTDYSGRVISDEVTAPTTMGQAHYVFYEDGYCNATTVTTCVHCYGKSVCYLCNGSGNYWHAYLKTNQPCPICGGRGVCQNCQGLGYLVSSKLWAPGEAEAYLHVQRNMSGSSSSHSNTSPNSGTYPDCGSSTAPAQVESGMSASYYQSMYQQYERLAESTYNTLTATGASITYSDNSKEGSTLGSWSSSDYSQLKRDLRQAQSNMQRIRSEASRAGHHISPSRWETATVSY